MTSIQIDRLDGLTSSVAYKGPCRVATTGNILLTGLQTIDGVELTWGDRVLVRLQDSESENGLYRVDSGPWSRTKDFNKTRDAVKGTRVWVTDGEHGPAEYELVSENPVNIGTSAVLFELSSGSVNAAALALAAKAAKEWAQSENPISVASGGDGLSDHSSKWWAERAADYANDAIAGGMVPGISTALAVSGIEIPEAIAYIRTGGYSVPGDGGDALYKRVASEPSHPGKVQSADGAWWELVNSGVTVEMFGARGNGIADDAPAFRACRDYMVAMGGGTIRAPLSNYLFASTETSAYYQIFSAAPPTISSLVVFLTLPAGISLVGSGKLTTKIITEGGHSTQVCIYPQDYANGRIEGFEISGHGSNVDAMHGIFFGPSVSYDTVSENITLKSLYIHDVSSYGIGQNMQLDKVRLEDIDTANTGADGIDWKVHGPYILTPTPLSRGVFMDAITVRDFGQRTGAGTPSGIGIRGAANLNNIAVYGIPDDMPGIDFVPGTALADTGDFRQVSAMSTLTNWYCEGANPKGTAIAVRSWSSFAVNIGQGTAKWAEVTAIPGGATPYAFDDGSHFHDIVCIPAHGRYGFRTSDSGTSFANCRVMSDKIYFDAKRNNLTAGQTQFNLQPWGGGATQTGASSYVLKNGVQLTATTDYTFGPNSLNLVTPALITDTFVIVFPPIKPFEIAANYCSIKGRMDRFCPWTNFTTTAYQETGSLDIIWDGQGNISRLNSSTVTGIAASPGVSGGAKSLRLAGNGTGLVEIDKPRLLNLPTSAPGTIGQLWNDGGIVKVVS